MLTVTNVVEVSEEKCIGCKKCDYVCPTSAIVTVGRLAVVDEERCTGCNKCIEACMDLGAISRKLLQPEEFVDLEADQEPHDDADIDALCRKARFTPTDKVCPCTGATAGDVAASVLSGEANIDDIALDSGVRGVCSMWCTTATLRIMGAAGLDQPQERKGWRLYPDGTDVSKTLWNISDDIAAKYPEYRLSENKEYIKHHDVALPSFPRIRRGDQ